MMLLSLISESWQDGRVYLARYTPARAFCFNRAHINERELNTRSTVRAGVPDAQLNYTAMKITKTGNAKQPGTVSGYRAR